MGRIRHGDCRRQAGLRTIGGTHYRILPAESGEIQSAEKGGVRRITTAQCCWQGFKACPARAVREISTGRVWLNTVSVSSAGLSNIVSALLCKMRPLPPLA